MPLRSMTGYGVATRAWAEGPEGCSVEVEARSVNSRYLEVKVRQPFGGRAEQLLRKRVEAHVGRGRVDIAVHLRRDRGADEGLTAQGVDPATLGQALAAVAEVERLAAERGVEVRGATAVEVLRFVSTQRGGEARLDAPPFLEAVADEALGAMRSMREDEGAALGRAIEGYASELARTVSELDPLLEAEPTRLAERMAERLAGLKAATNLPEPDAERIHQEVAALLLRGDVTEERVRIDAHLQRVEEVLGAPAARGQGKTLDFLCQELFREITTIGSKISSHEGSAIVIDAKAIVERLREQVQNVE